MENPVIQAQFTAQQEKHIIKPLQGVCKKCQPHNVFKTVKLKLDRRKEQLTGYGVSHITWCSYCHIKRPMVDQMIQCYLPIVNNERLSGKLESFCQRCGSSKIFLGAKLKWDQKMQRLVVFDASAFPRCTDCTFQQSA